MKPKTLFHIFAVLTLLLAGRPAHAVLYNVTSLLVGDSEAMTVHVGSYSANVLVGTYAITATPVVAGPLPFSGLLVNCISPGEIYANGVYDYRPLNSLTVAKTNQLNAVLFYAPTATADDKAGRAIALSEIATEVGLTGYDPNTGGFYVTGESAGALAAANLILGHINNSSWGPNPSVSINAFYPQGFHSQVLIQDPLVRAPEPASLAILGIGLLGLGLVSRKGKSA